MDAAQKRLVHQFGRLQVGCEHCKRLKWNFELLTGSKRQEINATFQRHDPAAQEYSGRHLLPAEVVDDQHAAVSKHLKRRPVETRRDTVAEFECIERELTAR